MQLSARVAEFEGEVMKGNEAVADLNSKLKLAAKRVENVECKKDGLKDRLQQSQRKQEEVDESITQFQNAIGCFNAGSKEDRGLYGTSG